MVGEWFRGRERMFPSRIGEVQAQEEGGISDGTLAISKSPLPGWVALHRFLGCAPANTLVQIRVAP